MVGPLLQAVKLAAFAVGCALLLSLVTPDTYALIVGVWLYFLLLAFAL